MKKLHKLRNQKGFTIVELLIVIVVIGILAALVLNAFSGVQAKARDTKRQTDVRAISSQLEAYYNGGGNGTYPADTGTTAAPVSPLTDSFAQTNWPGFDINAFRPPNNSASNSVTTGTAATAAGVVTPYPAGALSSSNDKYVYYPYTGTVGAASVAPCVAAGTCTHFILNYYSESGSAVQVKLSLN